MIIDKLFWIPPFAGNGHSQMALDEALLEWVRMHPLPTLVTRVYTWSQPTLSLGVHQSDRSGREALLQYPPLRPGQLVRRPTGGRAILHGDDVSFAFATNAPEILKLSLNDSYCLLMGWVHEALDALAVPLESALPSKHPGIHPVFPMLQYPHHRRFNRFARQQGCRLRPIAPAQRVAPAWRSLS